MGRKFTFIALVTVLALAGMVGPAVADEIRIATWNIQHLGNQAHKNYTALGRIGGHFDLIAVQEVMNVEGLDRFRVALEAETGEEWGRMNSHLIGRGSYKEKYGFVWRASRIKALDGGTLYVDRQNVFAREPFAARFGTADGSQTWVIANIHVIYGQSETDRIEEVERLGGLFRWLHESFPDEPNLILAGDFNLPPSHSAFASLNAWAAPVVRTGASTLSSVDGRFANLYDNLYVGHGSALDILGAQIVGFPAALGWTHAEARQYVSDHAPVVMVVDAASGYPQRYLRGGEVLPGPESRLEFSEADPGTTALQEEARRRADVHRTQRGVREGLPVIGNMRSNIYHLPECPSYHDVAPRNRREFVREADAQAAGFRRAGNC